MYEQPLTIPALLLLARAAAWTTAMSARRAADARGRSLSTAVARPGVHARIPGRPARRSPLPPPSSGLPRPSAAPHGFSPSFGGPSFGAFNGSGAGSAFGGGSSGSSASSSSSRGYTHWASALIRSRVFPAALRLALPVTAACMAVAAGTHGHYHPHRAASMGGSGSAHAAAVVTHGPVAAAAMAMPPPLAVADVSAARQLLAARGFVHPGMQPGAAWGAMPRGGGASGDNGELHVMYEYLLLFPA